MSNYIKITNFATKDSLTPGDANKKVKGTEIDNEFNAIATAVATKADLASPALTGTPTAPTAAAGTDTTQIATTAFVDDALTSGNTDVTVNDVTINGDTTSGMVKAWVRFDGAGSFAILDGYRITSFTRTAAGSFTFTFDSAFANNLYCVVGTTGGSSSEHTLKVTAQAAGSFTIVVSDYADNNTDDNIINLIVVQ